MNNKIILWVLGIVVVVIFLFFAYKLTNSFSDTADPKFLALKQDDHLNWSSDKKNILIEYSDFQCPACRNFHTILKTFEASTSADFALTKKITFVYRHFPLLQIHQNALNAAYAAEAAGLQGRFIAMADSLFDNQDQWAEVSDPTDFFTKLATDLQLDVDKFKKDMKSKEIQDRVNEDLDTGNKLGVNATPTFFLNGKKLDFTTLDDFKKALSNLK